MEPRSQSGKAEQILTAAEIRMRRGGYDAVSFRDLASDVGIKSASVHYHFPQKADLGAALVHRYREKFLAQLGAPDAPGESVPDRLGRLCRAYETAVVEEQMICLCCVLGAESQDLPEAVSSAVAGFFSSLLDWTERALAGRQPGTSAPDLHPAQVIAGLQGAMILALATGETEHFTQTAEGILARARAGQPRL